MTNPEKSDKNENPDAKRSLQFSSFNKKAASQLKKKPKRTVEEYLEGIGKGDRILLGQAITLIESTQPTHQALAQSIIEQCLSNSGQSLRIGITGTPGVGKSTFIESLGLYLTGIGKKVAVLAIDPTSQKSRGSILGDKTRMEKLSVEPNAFIRPSPAGSSLGGVARKTRETITLCEAAGFDTIIVETVGVGQSEVAVHSMVDFFLLLILPGAGDELQGIKRGIVEMADLIAVNKADGDRIELARKAKRAYRNALHLFPPDESGWTPPVLTCSGLDREGIKEIWEKCEAFHQLTHENGYFTKQRLQQAKYWLKEGIQNGINRVLETDDSLKEAMDEIENNILSGKLTSFQGAEQMLKLLFKR